LRPSETKKKIEIAADGETKKVYLDDMPDRAVVIGAHLSPEEEKELVQFLNKIKMLSHGQPKTCKVSTEISSSMLWRQMKK
jgi:urease beta subunit